MANHAGAIPSRRPGDHARHRDRAGPARLRPGRPPLQDACRSSARCGPASAASSPTPTTPTGCSASSSSSPWCSPRAPRAPARPTASATGCAASAAAASSRSPCGPACPVVPIAVVGAEESMPILFKHRRRWPRRSACPTSPSPPTCCVRPARRRRLLPGQVQAAGARPGAPSTSPPDQPRYSPQPDHGRVRGASASSIQEALYDMLRERRSVWFGLTAADGTTGARHRARHLLGRPGRPGPRSRSRRRGHHRPRHATSPTVELERTEYVRTDENYSILVPHREGHQGRHHRPHVPGRRLHPDARPDACTRSTSSAP